MEDFNSIWSVPWSSSQIKTVKISDGVTNIGNYAFCYCSDLTSVEIPGSVTSIGDDAFYNCRGLTRQCSHKGIYDKSEINKG